MAKIKCKACYQYEESCGCIKCKKCSNAIGACTCKACSICGEEKDGIYYNCDCCHECGKHVDDCSSCQSCCEHRKYKCTSCEYCESCCGCDDEEKNFVLTSDNKPVAKEKGSGVMGVVGKAKDAVKSDAVNAAYRVAAKNLVTIIKKPLLSTLTKQGMNKPMLEMVASFIDTELGTALLGYAIGTGICQLPWLSSNAKATRLAEECRIRGMEVFGDEGVKFAMSTFGPVFGAVVNYINMQPDIPGEDSSPLVLPMGIPSLSSFEELGGSVKQAETVGAKSTSKRSKTAK